MGLWILTGFLIILGWENLVVEVIGMQRSILTFIIVVSLTILTIYGGVYAGMFHLPKP